MIAIIILLLVLVLVLVLVGAVGCGWLLLKRPLAVLAWGARRSLWGGGLKAVAVPSPAGPQRVFVGGSGPVLVLLHGAGDQAGTWARVVPALLRHYTLVIPDHVLDDLVRSSRRGPLARFAATAASMEPWLLNEAQLRTLQLPVHLLWGASDRLMPLGYAERMLAALPDGRLRIIDRCGHVPQQEAPGRFLEALGRALQVELKPQH